MCAVCLQHLAVGWVVVRKWQRGQSLPEAFSKSQVLRGRVLELGQFHFILQDYQLVGLDNSYEKTVILLPVSWWIEIFNQTREMDQHSCSKYGCDGDQVSLP